jgi:hypothetical protein
LTDKSLAIYTPPVTSHPPTKKQATEEEFFENHSEATCDEKAIIDYGNIVREK